MLQTLEKYLRDAHDAGAIDHSLRARVSDEGRVTFYIHPSGRDGQTLDFVVDGDKVTALPADGEAQAVEKAVAIYPAHGA